MNLERESTSSFEPLQSHFSSISTQGTASDVQQRVLLASADHRQSKLFTLIKKKKVIVCFVSILLITAAVSIPLAISKSLPYHSTLHNANCNLTTHYWDNGCLVRKGFRALCETHDHCITTLYCVTIPGLYTTQQYCGCLTGDFYSKQSGLCYPCNNHYSKQIDKCTNDTSSENFFKTWYVINYPTEDRCVYTVHVVQGNFDRSVCPRANDVGMKLLTHRMPRFPIFHDRQELNCFIESDIQPGWFYYLDKEPGLPYFTDGTPLFLNYLRVPYAECIAVSKQGHPQAKSCVAIKCRAYICDYGAI
ncbi:unnamed protein product [Didymodactylos carnosus]|uniref:Uncharacterized protein n=1 Tax=Didymodactylos carnosus TaxID=1234261 RepID=A0A814ZCQ0_9BILA|nr:unnamed protein product [Didymodactylos carnosus]CAF4006023.1 unnamed protein product [Didymodactylos carnosus]